jgi:enoyl-CoA hydratase/3-hydroxyacyl-CoA dehydrogenase
MTGRELRLAVIGAGNMGSGIAQKMATEGFPVVLVDVDEAKVRQGFDRIRDTLGQGVERGIFREQQVERILSRIEATADWTELADVDLVVEAVFEDREVKQAVLRRLEDVCPPTTIIGTNTSSFSVTDLAARSRHPERIIGLHYFYHPAMNRLVEVVAGARTDPGVYERAWRVQEQLGKTPISSADACGFVVNRFFVQWLYEAIRVHEEGVANVATIDAAAMQQFGVGMGPFKLMNVTGIPIAMHAGNTMAGAFGPFYAPPRALLAQVRSGEDWPLEGEIETSKFETIVERIMGAVFQAAGELVDAGVSTLDDTDIGARVGLRWPTGPFGLINEIGVQRAAAITQPIADRWELALPAVLRRQAEIGEPFPFELVKREIRNDIAILTVNRPDTMNAVNEAVFAQLSRAVEAAAADDAVKGIVLAGAGKAFIAGADIAVFVRNIEQDQLDATVSFTQQGHALLHSIETAGKPVIARLHGLALGGGLEIALACDYIVAAEGAAMAFPETGIGIYPGLGGTQRTTRRVGVGLAKFLVLTGQMLGADDAAAIGLIDRVVPREQLDTVIMELIEHGVPKRAFTGSVPAAYRPVSDLFAESSVAELLALDPALQDDPLCRKAIEKLKSKGPVALRLAAMLIETGARLPLDEALALELEHLVEVFSTRDALAGLKSIGGPPPKFEGR